MPEHRRGQRVKTEGDRLAAQLEREKSIFKNLSWQVKQKERKIIFLQRYHLELQQMIRREQSNDSVLLQRAQGYLKRRKNHYSYHSNILQCSLKPSARNRTPTYAEQCDSCEKGTQSHFMGGVEGRRESNKK